MSVPRITAFAWVPPFAQGFVRDVRARWALEETGRSYAVDLVDETSVKSAAHRRLQPFGQVPTYTDGDVEIFESGAIALHVAQTAPGLLPDDPAAGIRAVQWLVAALSTIEPAVMQLGVVDVFEADCDWSAPRRANVVADIAWRLGDLSAALGKKTWLDGDTFTVGDLMMIAVLGGLRGTGILAGYPRLAAYVARGEARPAYRKAMADHMAVFAERAPA